MNNVKVDANIDGAPGSVPPLQHGLNFCFLYRRGPALFSRTSRANGALCYFACGVTRAVIQRSILRRRPWLSLAPLAGQRRPRGFESGRA
jgi:hypothetical protein